MLSDFDGWHAILNNHYHALSDQDYESFLTLHESRSSDELEEVKENSWHRIFDLKNFIGAVQGVTWEIKKEHVKKIKNFKAR